MILAPAALCADCEDELNDDMWPHDPDLCPHCDEFGEVHLEGGFYTVPCSCECHQ